MDRDHGFLGGQSYLYGIMAGLLDHILTHEVEGRMDLSLMNRSWSAVVSELK